MKWEYHAAEIGSYKTLSDDLKVFGSDGWELVTIFDNCLFIFKRPKPDSLDEKPKEE